MKQSKAKDFLPRYKQHVEILEAITKGKTIQYQNGHNWVDYLPHDDFDCNCVIVARRIKPTPTLRPWRPEEVPVGALLKRKGFNHKQPTWIGQVLGRNENNCFTTNGSIYTGGSGILEESFDYYSLNYEHSTDNGITWKVCGVEE